MRRMRLTMAVLFIVAFAAGLSLALTFKPREAENSSEPRRGSWLTRELSLTPEQQEKMRDIWSDMGRNNWQEEGERRREFQHERDEAVRALVPEEKRAELDKVLESYTQRMDDLRQERTKRFNQAVTRTKELLTPEQRTKYEEMMARAQKDGRTVHLVGLAKVVRGGQRGPGGSGPGGRSRRGPRPPEHEGEKAPAPPPAPTKLES